MTEDTTQTYYENPYEFAFERAKSRFREKYDDYYDKIDEGSENEILRMGPGLWERFLRWQKIDSVLMEPLIELMIGIQLLRLYNNQKIFNEAALISLFETWIEWIIRIWSP